MAAEQEKATGDVTLVDHDSVNFVAGGWADRVRRVSWGALLAGVIAAASIQLLLGILGMAFGLWSINPTTEANPVAGLATGTAIYWVITGVISMFVGGCIAGYMCGVQEKWDGALHGMVIWGLVTLVSFWYIGSTFGTVFNATASALGNGISTVADYSVPDMQSPNSSGDPQTSQTFALPNIDYERMSSELQETLKETGKDDLEPEAIEKSVDRLSKVAQNAAMTVAKKPESADQQIDRVIGAFFQEWQPIKKELDQDAITNVIAKNSEMSKEQAQKVVSRWQNQYQDAKQAADEAQDKLSKEMEQLEEHVAETTGEIRQTAAKVSGEALDRVANAAMWTFFAMLTGLISATAGGALGVEEVPNRFGRTTTRS